MIKECFVKKPVNLHFSVEDTKAEFEIQIGSQIEKNDS